MKTDSEQCFKQLKGMILACAEKAQIASIEDADAWREKARKAINEVFEGIDVNKKLINDLDGITFSAGGIMGTGGGVLLGPSEKESDVAFRYGVQRAAKLMDRCVNEIEKLALRFG